GHKADNGPFSNLALRGRKKIPQHRAVLRETVAAPERYFVVRGGLLQLEKGRVGDRHGFTRGAEVVLDHVLVLVGSGLRVPALGTLVVNISRDLDLVERQSAAQFEFRRPLNHIVRPERQGRTGKSKRQTGGDAEVPSGFHRTSLKVGSNFIH